MQLDCIVPAIAAAFPAFVRVRGITTPAPRKTAYLPSVLGAWTQAAR